MATILRWSNLETGVTDANDHPEFPGPILIEGVSIETDGAGDTTVLVRYVDIKEWNG